MIGLALQIGTVSTKLGFVGESEARIKTDSIYLASDSENSRSVSQYEEDLFKQEERIFGYNVDVWRGDVNAFPLFLHHWQDSEKELRAEDYGLHKEHCFKFLQDTLREIKEIKEKHHSISEEATEYGVIILEPTYLKRHQQTKYREMLAAILFEQLHLSALYFLKNSVATALSEAKNNAIVIDSGHNYTSVSRVIDGYNQKSINLNFGGSLISQEVQKLLMKRQCLAKTNFCAGSKGRCEDFEKLCRYKELTLFKQSFKVQKSAEVQEEAEVVIEFSDKSEVRLARDEIIQPFTQLQHYKKISDQYFPSGYSSLAKTVVELLEEDNNSSYIDTIILTGGNMLFSNLANKVAQQITRFLSNRQMEGKKIIKSSNPLASSWIGSSIVGSCENFHNYWVTAAEYREYGCSIINKKCPI